MSEQQNELNLTPTQAIGVALSIPMGVTEMSECQRLAPGVIDHLAKLGYRLEPTCRGIASAMDVVTGALRDDQGYRIAWIANIAMPFIDEMPRDSDGKSRSLTYEELHAVANRAASYVIDLLCKK